MERCILITFVVVLACAFFGAVNIAVADGGHGHGGHGGHSFGGHGFGGHHGYGGHGIHIGFGYGHHRHYSYGYPHYGYRSYYYPSYYYPSYSRSYEYPSEYGFYADSDYCGQPATVYRTSPPVEVAPRPGGAVETPSIESAPAPAEVSGESPNQPATQHQIPRAYLSALSVPTVRPIVSDEQAPWIVGEDVRPAYDHGGTVATSRPVNDRR